MAKVHPSDAKRLLSALANRASESPAIPPLKGLKGDLSGKYRLRSGKLRAILELDENQKTIFVERVEYRGNVYN